MSYIYLAVAIASEIVATAMLKSTESFSRLWPSIAVVTCVCLSLYCFSVCVQSLNVAIVYALWSGIGITAVTFLAWIIYGQKMDLPAIIGICLIIAGVVVINLYSKTVEIPE